MKWRVRESDWPTPGRQSGEVPHESQSLLLLRLQSPHPYVVLLLPSPLPFLEKLMVEPLEACRSHLTPLHPLGPNPPCPLMREGDMGGNCLGTCSDASFAIHHLIFWHNVKKAELGSYPTLIVLLTLEISASSMWLLISSWLPSFSLSTSGSTSLSSKLYKIQRAMQ